MTHRVYKPTENALNNGMNWEEAIYSGEIETVKEFETIDEALEYFENELGGDSDNYGVE